MAAINAYENLTADLNDTANWMFSSPRAPSEVEQLLASIRRFDVTTGGVLRLPSALLTEIQVEQSATPRVVIWGDSIVSILDERDVRFLDPTVEVDTPDNWDWTGGLDEDALYTAKGLQHSIIGFPPLDDVSPSEVTGITRQLDNLESLVDQLIGKHEYDSINLAEVRQTLEVIRFELRRPRPWRRTLRLALIFVISVLAGVVGNAVWTALHEPLVRLLQTVH